jgi:recombination protein RecA
MRLGEGEVIEDIQVVSTGSLGLDIALGVGGLPRGRVIEIYGPESSGKTTLTLQVIAEMQKAPAASAPLSMPSTRWTSSTRKSWA